LAGVYKSIINHSISLQKELGKLWTGHAQEMAALMQEYQPDCFDHTDTLLSNDPLCRALLDNEAGYQRTGALAKEAQMTRKLIRIANVEKIHDNAVSPLLTPELLKSLKTLSERGIIMVCYTYAIWHIRTEFHTWSAEKIAKTCPLVISKFSDHNVVASDEMKATLLGLENGSLAASLFKLDMTAAARLVPPVAVAGTPPRNRLSTKTSAPQASAPGTASTPSLASPASLPPAFALGADGLASKRRRLTDRLRKVGIGDP
jgi:hypothetical protein